MTKTCCSHGDDDHGVLMVMMREIMVIAFQWAFTGIAENNRLGEGYTWVGGA